jgi:AraC-like DNA-binding protein
VYEERPSRIPGAFVWRSVTDGEPVRVLPDGCMDLLWSDGALVVAGPDTEAHVFARRPGAPMTGLRFAPGFAPNVICAPASAFVDQRVPLSEVMPSSVVRQLEDELDGHHTPGAVIEAFAHRAAGTPVVREALSEAIVARIRRAMPVGRIADDLGMSTRQLHRRCLDAFGYGPKTLARVLRMVHALELARRGVPFADTAARSGYADQAHLSRDVKQLAGVSLRQLVDGDRAAKRSTELPSGSRTTA